MKRKFWPVSQPLALPLLAAVLGLHLGGVAFSHEGHEPLPTKGVLLDADRGTLVLSPDAYKGLALRTAPVELKRQSRTVLAYVKLVLPWRSHVFVSSTLGGRITSLHVQPGQMVEASTLLAEVTSAELESLQQELRQAVVNRDLARQSAERTRSLVASSAIAGRELVDAESKLQAAENAVVTGRVQLSGLGIDTAALSRIESGDSAGPVALPITAPIGGVVNHSDLAVGKVITANEHLFEVADLSQLWVKIDVLEQDIDRIKEGQKVEFELVAIPGRKFAATIIESTVAIDATTHLGTAWAELRNDDLNAPTFLPGFYGTANVETGSQEELPTVPAIAVQGVGAERYVLIETASTAKGHEYRKQSVVIETADSRHVQLQRGSLFPGDRVVTTGSQVLSSLFFLETLRLSPEGAKNIGLRVGSAQPRLVETILEFDGTLDLPPENRATVSAQIDGKLERIFVTPGMRVRKGDLLAGISSPAFQELQLRLLQAELELELAQNTLSRLSSLGGRTAVVAQRRVQEAESQVKSARASRDGARRQLTVAGLPAQDIDKLIQSRRPLDVLPIRSPVDGRVVQFSKSIGQVVTADELILEVHDTSRAWVRAQLSEQDAAQVRPGAPVRVRLAADPATIIPGRVVRSTRMLSPDASTLDAWIELEDGALTSGKQNMLARVTATLSAGEKRLSVPLDAIVREGTRSYVFVRTGDGAFERRPVETGLRDDRWVAIRSGLEPGTTIATHGSADLQTTYASVR